MTNLPAPDMHRLQDALPFWLSLGMIPLALTGATVGGWTVLLLPLYGWGLFSILDALAGLNPENHDDKTNNTTTLLLSTSLTYGWR